MNSTLSTIDPAAWAVLSHGCFNGGRGVECRAIDLKGNLPTRERQDEYGKRESNRKFSKRSHSREISVSGFRCPRRLTLYLPNASPFTSRQHRWTRRKLCCALDRRRRP